MLLTHAKASLTIIDEREVYFDLLSFLRSRQEERVDVEVWVGKRERLPVRLIAVRVSETTDKRLREQANTQVALKPKGSQLVSKGQHKLQTQESEYRSVAPSRLDDSADQ